MSIHTPPKNWFRPPKGAEKIWIGLALVWCMILSLAMPYWHFYGKQNSTGEAYSVKPKDFVDRAEKFIKANKVGEEGGISIVEPAPESDIYLIGEMWRWRPILKLKSGKTYRLHISSADLQHGFCLLPLNMNFHVLPGYDHVLTITPQEEGSFEIICNEFCGIGHHLMTGRVIVEK